MSRNLVGPEEAARLLREAGSLLFFVHVNPDGDSIGSTLAMARALSGAGKRTVMVEVDPCPRIYRFLPGSDQFTPWQAVEGDFDLAVCLDCGDAARVGAALPLLRRQSRLLNIDHHATNTMYGDFNYLDYSAASVGELAYRLLVALELPIDDAAAVCLYTAIVTDTGRFCYESTTAETHRIAARLIEAGVKPSAVFSAIWENEELGNLRLQVRVLQDLELTEGGRVAVIMLPRALIDGLGVRDEDLEGLVNIGRSIAGVEVSAMLRELPDGSVRAGLRSRGAVDVSQVASRLGGGGHPRASGCTLAGGLQEAREMLLNALRSALDG